MDIVQIGHYKGKKVEFLSQTHKDFRKRCERYVEKSDGPYYVFKPDQPNLTPLDYVTKAFEPLKQYKDKIGVVIDGSTTRGFMVPSAASLYSQHLGLKPEQYFDVTQACNGFAIAAEMAYLMYQTNPQLNDKYILVINNEQPPEGRGLLPTSTNDYKAVASYFVGLTFSTACTCTLFEKSENYSWQFLKHDQTEFASHISIPMPRIAKGFLPYTNVYDVNINDQYGQFCLPRLHQVENKILFIFQTINENRKFFKDCHVITHTFTRSVYEKYFFYQNLQQLSLQYNEMGNLGSCSFPFILAEQYQNGLLPKGQNFCFIGNAAGGSDVIINFTHQKVTKKQQQYTSKQIKLSTFEKYYITAKFSIDYLVKKYIFCQKREVYKVTPDRTDKSKLYFNDKKQN